MQGLGPYATQIKKVETDIKEMAKKVNDLCGKHKRIAAVGLSSVESCTLALVLEVLQELLL